MKNKKNILLLINFFITTCMFSQKDSVKSLEEIFLTAQYKINTGNIGNIETTINDKLLKKYGSKSLSASLAAETGLFIKNNGYSGLSTVSMRGTGASHTLLLWNGFPIESITSGTMDYTLFENGLINKVTVQAGGNSSLWGSSAIGGLIHLTTSEILDTGFHTGVNVVLGNFDNRFGALQTSFSNAKIGVQWKVFYHSIDNNFPFYNTNRISFPLDTLKENPFKQYGFIGDHSFYIKPNIKFIFRTWLQKSNRVLQPSMLTNKYDEIMDDYSIKNTLEYYHSINSKYDYNIKTAWFKDELIYKNATVFSVITTNRVIVETEHRYHIDKLQTINWGVYYNNNIGETKNYSNIIFLQKIAGLISYTKRHAKNNYLFNLSLREEYQNGIFPFTGKIGSEIKLYKNNFIAFNVSKNFRFPTLNDLYWTPGGNKELQPENSYYQEVIFKANYKLKNSSLKWYASVYNNFINNWIMWTPISSGIYHPKNIAVVWARGTEINLQYEYLKKDFSIKAKTTFFYNLSTNENENDKTKYKKQLIYIPIYKTISSFEIGYKKFMLRANYQFTGKRFITDNNKQFLPTYQLVDLFFSKEFRVKKTNIDLFLTAENIFDESYQTISNYVQPLRNFKIGTSLFF